MGYLLVNMTISYRNGSSKKGFVWQALRVLTACVLEVEVSVYHQSGMVEKKHNYSVGGFL